MIHVIQSRRLSIFSHIFMRFSHTSTYSNINAVALYAALTTIISNQLSLNNCHLHTPITISYVIYNGNLKTKMTYQLSYQLMVLRCVVIVCHIWL